MSTSGGVPDFTYPTPDLASGDAFEPLPGSDTTTVGLLNGTGLLLPFVLTGPISLGGLAVAVTTAGQAGSLVRLGLYRDNGHGIPSQLAADAGTVAGDAVAIVTANLANAVALTPGVYWTACTAQAAGVTAPTVTSYVSAPAGWPLPSALRPDDGYLTVANGKLTAYAVAIGQGAYPDPLPAVGDTTRWPRVILVAG